MRVMETELKDALIIEPKVFGDSRGYFFESWNKQALLEAGLACDFIQIMAVNHRPRIHNSITALMMEK